MADPNGNSVSALSNRSAGTRSTARDGFTLIESLVALALLALALAMGLGALAAVQHGLNLTVLQRSLDQRLEICHEALRGGLVDETALVEFGRIYLNPSTLEASTLPPLEGDRQVVRVDATPGEIDGLFQVEFLASDRRGRIERSRRLATQIFVPGAGR